MNVLVTSSRMPFALDIIRKLARAGHRVIAGDCIRVSAGNASRYAADHVLYATPQLDPERFIADIEQIIYARRVDLVVPCFEDIYYLARHRDELSERTQLFCSPLDVLARMHHKGELDELMQVLGVRAPRTTHVSSRDELDHALREYPRYMARPAFSRGGIYLFTNTGPLAGHVTIDSVNPSPADPWIVQEYIDGRDVCSSSIAQHGRLVLHCTYVHPMEIEHGGGIVFESIDDPEAGGIVEQVVQATGFHGQLGMDFRRNADGLWVIECNPRPTAGLHLVDDDEFDVAVMGPEPARPLVIPAGRRRKYAIALWRDMLLHWSHAPTALRYLFGDEIPDVVFETGDSLPALVQVLSYAYGLGRGARERVGKTRPGVGLMATYFDGISWNGGYIP